MKQFRKTINFDLNSDNLNILNVKWKAAGSGAFLETINFREESFDKTLHNLNSKFSNRLGAQGGLHTTNYTAQEKTPEQGRRCCVKEIRKYTSGEKITLNLKTCFGVKLKGEEGTKSSNLITESVISNHISPTPPSSVF